MTEQDKNLNALKIGWAQTDITPPEPVLISGQFHARLSEGVNDPITATALAMESKACPVILVSCDLVSIPDEFRDTVREKACSRIDGLDPKCIILNATHTHTGPEVRTPDPAAGHTASRGTGIELGNMKNEKYIDLATTRIAEAVREAWEARHTGGIAYGQGHAVVGRNRRWVDTDGVSTMYGNTDTPDFSHIEGYEDHTANILGTYDENGTLTGLVVNVACPSQVSEQDYRLSADYWRETRLELRRRFGEELFVLPQCSAAGDQSPRRIYEKGPEQRMRELHKRSERDEIALRIATAVEDLLPAIRPTIDDAPRLQHRCIHSSLPMNALTKKDAEDAAREADTLMATYEEEKKKIEENPELKKQPRWYKNVTRAFRRAAWYGGVVARFEKQSEDPTREIEWHVLRLGDAVFATNPFEYYLDYGAYIKARSSAAQTFLVQLAGGGTYVPSARSIAGGGYGSVPASNPVGPEGGRMLAEETAKEIAKLFPETTNP